MALLVSFFAKALSNTGYFCYQSMASAGIVMVSRSVLRSNPSSSPASLTSRSLFLPQILPGYIILNGALELASRSIVAGSIRVVYGCVLSLFLGTGISLGSEIFVGASLAVILSYSP